MALIDSEAVGLGSQSVGVFTYRRVKGRTIASRRVRRNKSQTEKQVVHRTGFSEMGRLARSLARIIEVGYDYSKTGSRRNNFSQSNPGYLSYLKGRQVYSTEQPPIKTLYNALNDPKFQGSVMSAKGEFDISCIFEWDTEEVPCGILSGSYEFKAGDAIVVGAAFSFTLRGTNLERVKLFETVLKQEEIDALNDPGEVIVNKEMMPSLSTFMNLPTGATNVQVIITGMVLCAGGGSTSYFQAMPDRPYTFESRSQTITDSNATMTVLAPDAKAFTDALYEKAEGSKLMIGGEACPFKTYADGTEYAEGLVFDPPAGYSEFGITLGAPAGRVELVKDGQVIAYIEGLLMPEFAI